jgi:hypothetical protein
MAQVESSSEVGFNAGIQIIWEDLAACKGKTALFFAPPGERPGRRARREAAALKVCHECEVMLECRSSAREAHENGIWGGETEEDRAAAGYAPRAITRRAVAGARQPQSST